MAMFSTYSRFPVTVQEAIGATVVDTKGKKYLDFTSGIGVCNLGHRHPEVQKSLEEQLNKFWHLSNLFNIPIQEEVAQLLTKNSVGEYVFFSNSGAEANEAAIKLARKFTKKEKIITFQKSFHGRTFATMAATGQEKIKEGYGSMLPTFEYAVFNDIDSVQQLIDDDTAAIMLEVVQGEGGVHPASDSFMTQLEAVCKENDLLLIIDEIQTGIGRTAKRFGYEHYGIEPDIFTIAKGLGNGVPVGAMIAKKEYAEAFGPGAHGSTFGGNPLAMASAKAVLTTLFNDAFLQEVEEKSSYLHGKLEKEILPLPLVKDIRQKGLMIGIECEDKVADMIPLVIEKGLLALSAGEKVIRLLPPLTISREEIHEAVRILNDVLSNES